MAFNLNNWGRLSSTVNESAPIGFGYSSTGDNLATITASAYFNTVKDSLKIKDFIWIGASDENEWIEVTAVTPNVTTQVYQPAPGALVLADGDLFVGNASNVATAVTLSGDVTNDNAGVVTIGNQKVTEAKMAFHALTSLSVKEVADKNTNAGIPVVYRIDTPGGITATTTVTLDFKTRVTDVIVQLLGLGTAGDTVVVQNDVVGPITDTMDINKADKTLVRPTTIDDLNQDIVGDLKIIETDGGGSDSPAVRVTVYGYLIA